MLNNGSPGVLFAGSKVKAAVSVVLVLARQSELGNEDEELL